MVLFYCVPKRNYEYFKARLGTSWSCAKEWIVFDRINVKLQLLQPPHRLKELIHIKLNYKNRFKIIETI